jgi:OOP family OmpA-OmpF porin
MRRPTRLAAALCAATAALSCGTSWFGAGTAHATDCAPISGMSPCVDSQSLWVHPGPGRFIAVGPGQTTPDGQAAFGLLVSWMSRPIGLRMGSPDPDGVVTYLVEDAIDATYWTSLGVTDRLELSLAAPVTFFQSGAGLGAALGTGEQLPRSTVRDPRFGLAYAVIPRPRAGNDDGLSLVARGEMAVPLGNEEGFGTASTTTFAPSVAAEYRYGIVTVGSDIGARIRGESPFADAVWGSQMGVSTGASFLVWQAAKMRVGAEAYLLASLDSQPTGEPLTPSEWIAHVAAAPFLEGDVGFVAGGGTAIPWGGEAALTTPRFRFNLGVRYAPEGRDTDADGVLDRDDACPRELEDRDGFQDADGCPDPDNDGDRIPDVRDRCRDQAETFDGFEDDDGCPDDDDDRDGVPDELDQCRAAPEDKDGVADDDGCPEDDDDGDGVPDANDKCPRGAEDKDGFRDEDGCPDPDNDADGIADDLDQCPTEREDKDGFQDEDGCPETDNDADGVDDAADKCPTEPETIDGRDDQDGCPEAGATTKPRWSGSQIVIDGLATFEAGKAEPTPALAAQIRMMAQLARTKRVQVVIVEAWPDKATDASAKATDLASQRAEQVRRILASAGLPADRITAASGDPREKRGPKAPQIVITVQPQTGRSTAAEETTP